MARTSSSLYSRIQRRASAATASSTSLGGLDEADHGLAAAGVVAAPVEAGQGCHHLQSHPGPGDQLAAEDLVEVDPLVGADEGLDLVLRPSRPAIRRIWPFSAALL